MVDGFLLGNSNVLRFKRKENILFKWCSKKRSQILAVAKGGGTSYTFGSFNFRRVYKASKLYLPQSYRSKSTRLQERKATDFSP